MRYRYRSIIFSLLLALTLFITAATREYSIHLNSDSDMRSDKNAHPLVTFVIVGLGGFRGIVADVLWLRTSALQEKGRFVELVQLAEWITRLQPRAEKVWGFHAWNLSYNVSVMMPRPEDRWRWVQSGITLLRDEALDINPDSAYLHTELGWIFQHKIGESTDDASEYYRKQLAEKTERIIKNGTLPASPSRDIKNNIRTLFKMDPQRMLKLNHEFGPIDWRVPQAHALYWADKAGDTAEGFEAIRAERITLQCLSTLLRKGRLASTPLENREWEYRLQPQTAPLDAVNHRFLQSIQKFPGKRIDVAYRYFLGSVVILLEKEGEKIRALQWLAMLHNILPDDIDKPTLEELMTGTSYLGE